MGSFFVTRVIRIVASRSTLWAGCCLLVLWDVARRSLPAQDTVLVVDPGRYPLQIEARRMVNLRPPLKPFVYPTAIHRDARGMYYVLDQMSPEPLWVFDSSGKPHRQVLPNRVLIDRTMVRALTIARPDTLHVLSGGDAVVDRNGRVVHRFSIPDATIWGGLALPSGNLVIRAIVGTPDRFGYPLHLVARDGSIKKSFGAANDVSFDGNPSRILGGLALAGNNNFWSNEFREYRLKLWSIEGELLKVYERRAPWFKPWHSWNGGFAQTPPPSRLTSVWQDAHGRVWTLVSVAASGWRPAPEPTRGREPPPSTAEQFERANDSIVEVLDAKNGTVVASRRFRAAIISFLDDSLIAVLSPDSSRAGSVDVWHLRLIPSQRR